MPTTEAAKVPATLAWARVKAPVPWSARPPGAVITAPAPSVTPAAFRETKPEPPAVTGIATVSVRAPAAVNDRSTAPGPVVETPPAEVARVPVWFWTWRVPPGDWFTAVTVAPVLSLW